MKRIGSALALALRGALLGALLGTFSGCGGGIVIGLGNGFDNTPPSVSVALPAGPVRAGDTLHVSAAAADNDGIDTVAFYRVDSGRAVLLGSVGSEPYGWDLTVPADGRTTLSVFARATDWTGNRADSATASVDVVP